ncbi:hypothetical protein BGX26_002546 [Mortierella sp. AD094]|nr:hypothetical protein BGX26_002546 [Mortierella sp. AD094]
MTHQICGLCSTDSRRQHLPLVDIEAHTTILETISRTRLTQTFFNPPENGDIEELQYTFPLYDGVSVVGFTCHIGDRTIVGQVKVREKAKQDFEDAVNQGKKAALLEQLPSSSDVFTTTIGNITSGAEVIIEISYIGELMHDAEVDGIRFTIPTTILPRYGDHPIEIAQGTVSKGHIQFTVDVVMAATSVIQQIQSPSHPIAVSIGTTSLAPGATSVLSKASATLSLGSSGLDKDFVIQVVAKDTGVPTAILETHPAIPNQRALMTTLVPRFSLPPEKPEIVFICDRSGSMQGSNITLAKSALRVFMKSLPVGIKFNICSFGNQYSFMWDKSQSYTQSNLDAAIKYVDAIEADMGGTEMYDPIKATIENRYKDIPLEIMLLTDGAIWNHQKIFDYLNKQAIENKAAIRVFTLGVGSGVSHALIQGVAKSGNGFSQTVGQGEKMEGKVVRMLKGALSPHVVDYTLELKYSGKNRADEMNDDDDDDEFVMVERVADSLNVKLNLVDDLKDKSKSPEQGQEPTSIYDTSADIDKQMSDPSIDVSEERYSHLPSLAPPKLLQTPHIIPPLYAFDRTNIYLLMGPECNQMTPSSVVLRGTSKHGPLELEIPIQVLDTPGETIHQLATKKATAELEQGRGWITQAKDEDGFSVKSKFESQFKDMIEREAVRLGVQFQVQGKWTSFVAIEVQQEDGMPAQDHADDTTSQIPSGSHKEASTRTLYTGEGLQQPLDRSSFLRRTELEAKRMRLAELRRARESRRVALGTQEFREFSTLGSREVATQGSTADVDSLVSCLVYSKYDCLVVDESDSDESESDEGAQTATAGRSRFFFSAGDDDSDDSYGDMGVDMAVRKCKKKKTVNYFLDLEAEVDDFCDDDDEDDEEEEENVVATTLRLNGSKLDILIDLQTFQGPWNWDQMLFKCIGVTATDAEKVAKDNGWDEKVVATALAILFFEKKLAEDKDTWELVVDKARGWLEEQIGQDGIVAVLQEATKLVV